MHYLLLPVIFAMFIAAITFAESKSADITIPPWHTSQGIELFKKRIAENPNDYLSLVILANLYLKEGRLHADLDLYSFCPRDRNLA
jgi:hypothetical protein